MSKDRLFETLSNSRCDGQGFFLHGAKRNVFTYKKNKNMAKNRTYVDEKMCIFFFA